MNEWLPKGRAPRCISLTRVSRDPKFDTLSHETQHAGNLRCIAEIRGTLYKHYQETVSGALYTVREETQQAIEDLENDRADYLILYDMTRYGRSVRWQQEILHRIEQANKRIQLATFRLEYDERENRMTIFSRYMFNTCGNTSELERLQIRERTMRGLRAHVQKGKQMARGWPAFGYYCIQKKDVIRGDFPENSEGSYVVKTEEAEIPPLAFEKYKELKSFRATASWLNENGYRTRSGAPWRPSNLRSLFTNPIFKGQACYSRYIHLVDESRAEHGLSIRYKRLRKEEEVFYVSAPPLVSEELWNEVNAIMRSGKEERSGPRSKRYALTGLVFCPKCGKRMYTCRSNKKHLDRPYGVKCSGAVPPSPQHEKTCEATLYSGNVMDFLTTESLCFMLENPEPAKEAQAEFEKQKKTQKAVLKTESAKTRIEKLKRDIETQKQKENKAASAMVDAMMKGSDGNAFEAVRAQAEAKRRELELVLQELEMKTAQLPTVTIPKLSTSATKKLITALRDPELQGMERGEALSTLIEKIYPIPFAEQEKKSAKTFSNHRQGNLAGIRVVLKSENQARIVLETRITERGTANNINQIHAWVTVVKIEE